MNKLLKDWTNGKDLGILILRLVLGFSIFYGHGLGKWNKLLTGDEIQFLDPIGIGVETSFYLIIFAEGVCFLFVMLGFLTRLALIPLMIAMFVAAFVFHSGHDFGQTEGSMIFFFGFLALFISGAGKYSVDNFLVNRKKG